MGMGDITLIRLIGHEPVEALDHWGRWLRQRDSRPGRSQGIEGRFRSNRCPACYELPDPCTRCRAVAASLSVAVDPNLAMKVERAVVKAFPTEREQAVLLAHYRGVRKPDGRYIDSNPKIVCRQMGIPIREYESLIARLSSSVWRTMNQQK